MLDRLTWINDLKIRMGCPIIKLAVTDEMIGSLIEQSLRKVIPYLNSIEHFTVDSKVTEIKDRLVYAVVRVHSTRTVETTSITDDPLLYTNIYYTSTGSSTRLIDNALYSYYSNQVREGADELAFRFIGNTLYIDNGTPPFSVEAITDRSVENMSEDYVNWCFEYSLSLLKIVEGEIRSKVKIEGSPIEMNGSDLKSEGISDRDKLEERLGSQLSLNYSMR